MHESMKRESLTTSSTEKGGGDKGRRDVHVYIRLHELVVSRVAVMGGLKGRSGASSLTRSQGCWLELCGRVGQFGEDGVRQGPDSRPAFIYSNLLLLVGGGGKGG